MVKNLALGLSSAIVICFAILVQGQSLPNGNAKALVEKACRSCHAATMITSAGHTPEDWKLLVERMVSAGADVPQNQMASVSDYLAKNFPETNVPKAVIVPGTFRVSFKARKVPPWGSRPHHLLPTHHGYLWATGQNATGSV